MAYIDEIKKRIEAAEQDTKNSIAAYQTEKDRLVAESAELSKKINDAIESQDVQLSLDVQQQITELTSKLNAIDNILDYLNGRNIYDLADTLADEARKHYKEVSEDCYARMYKALLDYKAVSEELVSASTEAGSVIAILRKVGDGRYYDEIACYSVDLLRHHNLTDTINLLKRD